MARRNESILDDLVFLPWWINVILYEHKCQLDPFMTTIAEFEMPYLISDFGQFSSWSVVSGTRT